MYHLLLGRKKTFYSTTQSIRRKKTLRNIHILEFYFFLYVIQLVIWFYNQNIIVHIVKFLIFMGFIYSMAIFKIICTDIHIGTIYITSIYVPTILFIYGDCDI